MISSALLTPFGFYSFSDFVNVIFDQDQVFWRGGYSQKEKIGKDEKGKPIFQFKPKIGTFFTPNAIDPQKVMSYNSAKHKDKNSENNEKLRRGITQKTMGELTCCYAEFDEGTTEEQFNHLLSLLDSGDIPCKPSAIVHSGDSRPATVELFKRNRKTLLKGKSLHLFWRFNEPVTLEEWKRIQISLIHVLQSDEALKDPCRSMRFGGVISDQSGPFDEPDFKNPFDSKRRSRSARAQTILYLGERVSKDKMIDWSNQVFRAESLQSKRTGQRGKVFKLYRNESTIFNPRTVTTEVDGETISIWNLAKSMNPGESLSICSPFHEDHSPSAKLFVKNDGQIAIRNYSSNAPSEWCEADRNAELVYDDALELSHEEFHALPLTKKLNVYATQMGSGKTHKVQELVNDRDSSILAITAKRSLVGQMSERLNVEHYEHLPPDISDPRCAICINSLMRVKEVRYDYVFIDEFEEVAQSLFGGFIQPKDALEIMHRLRLLLKEAGKIIIADANASLPTVETFMELAGLDEREMEWVTGGSPRQPCEDKSLYVHPNADSLRVHVEKCVKEKKKLFVGFTQKSEAIAMERQIRKWVPETKIKTYHADSSQSRLAELQDVNTHWAEADVVLSSPVVSSGVSFDVPGHFDHIVLFGNHRQGGLVREEILQQMGRVRKPINPVVHACFTEAKHQRPRDFLSIASSLLDANRRTRQFLMGCSVFCDTLIETPLDIHFFNATVRTELVTNIRSYDIKDLMCRYWIDNGGEVRFVNPAEDEEAAIRLEELKEEKKEIKRQIREENINRVATAEEIDDETASEMEKRTDSLEPEEKDSLWLYKIQNRMGNYFLDSEEDRKLELIDESLHARLLSTIDRFVDMRMLYETQLPSEIARRDFEEVALGLLGSKNKGARLIYLNELLYKVCNVRFSDLFTLEGAKKWENAEWSREKLGKGSRSFNRKVKRSSYHFDTGTDLGRTHAVSGVNSVLRYFGFKTKMRQVRVKGSNKKSRERLYSLDMAHFRQMMCMSQHWCEKRENSELDNLAFMGVTLPTVRIDYSEKCDTEQTCSVQYAKAFCDTLNLAILKMKQGAVAKVEDISSVLGGEDGKAVFALKLVTDPNSIGVS